MECDLEISSFSIPSGGMLKERYDFFIRKITEVTDALVARFEDAKELVPLEWTLRLGRKVAEIHHNSRTWCFCDCNALIKQINESEEPVYLGMMGHRWKAWQNNDLQPNEVIVEGTAPLNGDTRRARLFVDN
jgi:hypothetical protein